MTQRKKERRVQADKRNIERSQRSNAEQLALLDAKGKKANRERTRLTQKKEDTNA